MQHPSPRRNRQRRRLLAATAGLVVCLGTPAAQAADNLVFVSGGFRRSIAIADLHTLASTGSAPGLLGDVLRFTRQDPKQVAKLLNQSASLPLTLVSRLLGTRIGEAILERASRIVYPLNAPGVGVPALRSAVIMALADGKGSISPITFLKSYPTRDIEVSIPALLGLMRKASSISDLVRFFSESPLDGLRGNGDTGAQPQQPSQKAEP
ncbi:MAG: hypothetical protein RLZZ468_59 [Cyanobacteriota bacterium]